MEAIYARYGGTPDVPHRHDYYILMIVTEQGRGKHYVDFTEFPLEANQVYFISPGQVHQVIEEEMSKGFVLTFDANFLLKSNIRTCFIEDLHLFHEFGNVPPLVLEQSEFEEVRTYAEKMLEITQNSSPFKEDALGALLKLLLISCNSACSITNQYPNQIGRNVEILRSFKKLLDKSYQKEHKVKHYAAQLSITPDYLNTILKSLTGNTAKKMIQTKIIIEAKRLLLFSSMSQKEIAYQLGFEEPTHFSLFFKKYTGVSPRHFMEANTQDLRQTHG